LNERSDHFAVVIEDVIFRIKIQLLGGHRVNGVRSTLEGTAPVLGFEQAQDGAHLVWRHCSRKYGELRLAMEGWSVREASLRDREISPV
jgi:hypothetical protein